MCDIQIIETNGTVESFNATYQDCNGKQGSIEVTKDGNDFYIVGENTAGETIETEAYIKIQAGVNPTKVFKLIAKALKKYLCPTCY